MRQQFALWITRQVQGLAYGNEQVRDVVIVGGESMARRPHPCRGRTAACSCWTKPGGSAAGCTRSRGRIAAGSTWARTCSPRRPSRIAALVAEAGLNTLPVPGVGSAIWFGDRPHTRRRVEAYPVVLPLSARERVALARAGLTIRLLAARNWRRSSCMASGASRGRTGGTAWPISSPAARSPTCSAVRLSGSPRSSAPPCAAAPAMPTR